MSDEARFDRLTRRHRECLRLVRQLKRSKEIAGILGIEKSTVDGYLAEAVRLLGARDRRDAALLFERYEQHAAAASRAAPDDTPFPPTPAESGGDSARLSARGGAAPRPVPPGEPIAGASGGGQAAPVARATGVRLPIRRKGQGGNDLPVADRLIWIQVIAVGTAVGFGMLATGIQALTDLLARLSGQAP